MDPDLLRSTWAEVARHGDQVPKVFYLQLFFLHPETRRLFPNVMTGQRDKFVRALGGVVSKADDLDAVVPLLQRLGRDHRRFGAIEAHYAPVGEVLLLTLEHFLGDAWTPEVAEHWQTAYTTVANVMIAAARLDETFEPAYWDSKIMHVELNRTHDRAFIAFEAPAGGTPEGPLPVALHAKPGGWVHVQPFPVDGGWAAYVDITDDPRTLALSQAQPGDQIRLGQPGEPIETLLEDQ